MMFWVFHTYALRIVINFVCERDVVSFFFDKRDIVNYFTKLSLINGM